MWVGLGVGVGGVGGGGRRGGGIRCAGVGMFRDVALFWFPVARATHLHARWPKQGAQVVVVLRDR